MIAPQKLTLLIILFWCILEVTWNRLPGFTEPGLIRVLLIVSVCPELMEGTVRLLHWELNYVRRTPVEIGLSLDLRSEDYSRLAGLLVRDGLVTAPIDEEPDMVIRI